MKPTRNINRRQFLRGMMAGGLVTLHLPMLELFMSRKALAQDGGFPKRFGLFYWGNGNRPENWVPTGEGFGDDWTLSQSLQALAPVKDKLSVVTGMSTKVPNTSPHWSTGRRRLGTLFATPHCLDLKGAGSERTLLC